MSIVRRKSRVILKGERERSRVVEGSEDAWNEYCEKCRVLKGKILLHDSYMKNINEIELLE